jgi:hypothetical protein
VIELLFSNFVGVEVRDATAEMLRAKVNESSFVNRDVFAAYVIEQSEVHTVKESDGETI